MRINSDPESESNIDAADTSRNEDNSIERSVDDTLWKILEDGRLPAYNIFKDVSEPTAYAKNILCDFICPRGV